MKKTITGADMKVFFGFKNVYIYSLAGKNIATVKEYANSFTWFDAGTVTQIRYSAERDVTPKYTLTSLDPQGAGKGIVFTQGDIIFKNFNKDSVLALFEKVVYGTAINDSDKVTNKLNAESVNRIASFESDNSGFINITGNELKELTNNTNLNKYWSKVITNWDEMPFFDIKIISKTPGSSDLSYLEIRDVKVTDVGSAESIDSTEINDIVKFMAIGGVTPWKRFGDK